MTEATGTAAELPSAFTLGLPRLVAGRRVAVFLDFDGTLSPIVERAEDARIDAATRAVVASLAGSCAVAIVSGRDIADVRARVGLPGIAYSGGHGLDFVSAEGEEWHYRKAAAHLPNLAVAEAELRARLGSLPGVELERKRFSLAVHYRRADPADIAAIEYAVRHALQSHPGLRETPGKMVHELRPALDWSKGEAVLWMLDRLGLAAPDVLAMYFGDDATDEDAFTALADRGIGIVVRDAPYPSRATHSLRNPEEVRLFLGRLAEAAGQRE